MRAQLKLVKPAPDATRAREVEEIRYRYPAIEEVWEVSCDAQEHFDEHRFTGPGAQARPSSRKAS